MRSKKILKIRKPRQLQRGDAVALIRPGAYLDEKAFEQTTRWVEDFGFEVLKFRPALKQDLYFSGTDQTRAKEWAWAFSEPKVKAVLTCRGGYGTMRTLAEFSRSRRQIFRSKILTGFSDLTFAHQWVANQFHHLSFHSPLVGQLEKQDLFFFLNQLIELPIEKSAVSFREVEVLQKGKADGVLLGGNLSLFQTSGPAAFPQRPFILALEEINEDFYRMDRAIWTLIHSGYSKWVRGILVGNLSDCGRDQKRFPFDYFLKSLKRLSSGPIWRVPDFGHGLKRQQILPIGMPTSLINKKMIWHEACVE